MVALNPKYRNTRDLFYSEKQADSQGIGTILQVLKSTEGSFDHSFKPALIPGPGGTTAYVKLVEMQNQKTIQSINILDISTVMDLNIKLVTILNYMRQLEMNMVGQQVMVLMY